MKSFELTFLGTGTSQGVPVIGALSPVNFSDDKKDKRLRSSALLKWKNGTTILIDCGPDFRFQMLRENISNISAIVFTHQHSDHTAGIDDIRPICHIQNKKIPIYAKKSVISNLKKRYEYIFAPEDSRYPGAPEVESHKFFWNKEFEIEGIKILPFKVMHGELPITGFKVGKLAYISDASFIEHSAIKKLKGIKTLVINALRIENEHPTHFILKQSLEVFKQIAAEEVYFTHISAAMGFYKEVEPTLPKGAHLAYDGLKIKIDY